MDILADTVYVLWGLGVAGYLLGMIAHTIMWRRYWAYRPYARYRIIVDRWLFDESRRIMADELLMFLGLGRLALMHLRTPASAAAGEFIALDYLMLIAYWGLLLLFKHWTWRTWRSRRREEAILRQREALE